MGSYYNLSLFHIDFYNVCTIYRVNPSVIKTELHVVVYCLVESM